MREKIDSGKRVAFSRKRIEMERRILQSRFTIIIIV